jgi:DNA-directed RNA polymerase subunit RPC12/RpoP
MKPSDPITYGALGNILWRAWNYEDQSDPLLRLREAWIGETNEPNTEPPPAEPIPIRHCLTCGGGQVNVKECSGNLVAACPQCNYDELNKSRYTSVVERCSCGHAYVHVEVNEKKETTRVCPNCNYQDYVKIKRSLDVVQRQMSHLGNAVSIIGATMKNL